MLTDHTSQYHRSLDFPAQFLVDVDAHDVVERGLGAKAERGGTTRVEPLRPAGDDPVDCLVGLAADARGHFRPGDAGERFDLLADRAGDTGHGEVEAVSELPGRE